MAKVIIFHTPVRYGGGERQLILLSKEFNKANLDFIIVNLAKSEEFEKELSNNRIDFFTITNKKLGDSPSKKKYLFHFISLLPSLFNRKLINLYKGAKVIYARDFPANFFVYFLLKFYGHQNKKFIYSRHFYKNPEKGLIKKIYLAVLKNFDILICVSNFVSQSLRQIFPELSDKIITIPNGIDLERFKINDSKENLRKKLDLPLNDKLAIYVARFSKQKNHLFLVKVLAKVSDFKLILIGEGETKDDFLKEIEKNNLQNKIIILGYIKNELIPNYLLASDFCLFVSKGEGFSNAILESLASGLPTIIFEDIYTNEYEDGVLVAKNEEEFIDLTKKLIEDKDFYNQTREKALRVVKKFDIKNVAQKYLDIFEK